MSSRRTIMFSPRTRGEPEGGRWRASQKIQQRAKELRKQMTPAEVKLWNALRGEQVDGAYFRRQHAVGPYILDFYCAKAKLAIEVDGGSHLNQEAYDAERTAWLETEKGIRVVRFTNQDVLRDLDEVIESIRAALRNFESCQGRAREDEDKTRGLTAWIEKQMSRE